MRRCRIQYYPKHIPPFSLKLVLAQFIYSALGRVPLYESENPFELEIDCSPFDAMLIQRKVDAVMPLIELSSTKAVFWQLFLNGIYVDSNIQLSTELWKESSPQLRLALF